MLGLLGLLAAGGEHGPGLEPAVAVAVGDDVAELSVVEWGEFSAQGLGSPLDGVVVALYLASGEWVGRGGQRATRRCRPGASRRRACRAGTASGTFRSGAAVQRGSGHVEPGEHVVGAEGLGLRSGGGHLGLRWVGAARLAHFSTPCRSMSSLSDPRRVLPRLRMVSRCCIVLRDVDGPSGHDRAAGIEQVGTLVGALNAFDGVAERQFGDLAVDALLGAPRPERRPQPVCGAAPVE